MKKIILICALLTLVGCTDSREARRILQIDGYTDIEITGYSVFGCSEDDFQRTGFTAQKNGYKITGTVCGGLFFKNKTIRFK